MRRNIVRSTFSLVCLVVLAVALAACGSSPMVSSVPTNTPVAITGTFNADPTAEPPTQALPTATMVPEPEILFDWSSLDQLQGSTFEFYAATHRPENTQPFTGYVLTSELNANRQEQPKGSIGIVDLAGSNTTVVKGTGNLVAFVTCRELDQATGRSANNKRTIVFGVLEGTTKDSYLQNPLVLTVHSFAYRGDARVDWGEQFKLMGNAVDTEDELWPAQGAFVVNLSDGRRLVYNYIAGINVHFRDDVEISTVDIGDLFLKYQPQLQGMIP